MSPSRFYIILLFFLSFTCGTRGQEMPEFPWAGGINACQFCPVDLNLDGIKDLLIFDRHGNRKLTFLNKGIPNTIGYTFAPAYGNDLPDLHDWVITEDFDHDGKQDLFTYGSGGIRVFRNISDKTLKFKLVTDMLVSLYYTTKIGILVTPVDYPAISDIDSDGDPDLLTFFGLGSFVEFHRNMSMEKYGRPDSLDFRLEDRCWGKFMESETGNQITLNVNCPFTDNLPGDDPINGADPGSRLLQPDSGGTRHTGSTMLAIDLNGDGLKDLILGDIDNPGLIALYNGGTPDQALMVSQEQFFPLNSAMVHLFSFPVPCLADIDNDGVMDLVVSPFDPSLFISDNYNCVWFYKNNGTNEHPVYQYITDDLFRHDMMDFGTASHPVLADLDGDGLEDLFVGNFGYYDSSYYYQAVLHSVYCSRITYYRNTGTQAAPVFTYVTDDFGGIAHLKMNGLFPAIGDLNGDGKKDLLAGTGDGTVIFFENAGGDPAYPGFHPAVTGWKGIDAGDFSAPQIFDLDQDGKPDLVLGRQDGKLSYYRNSGTLQNPEFKLETDNLGGIDVTNYQISYDGFSTPCFYRTSNGTTLLVVGSDEGKIHWYGNIDGNLGGNFTELSGLYASVSSSPTDTLFGWQTSPAMGHLTDPAEFDLITGNFSGGMNYLTRRKAATILPGIEKTYWESQAGLIVKPNPADNTILVTCPDNPGHGRHNLQIINISGQIIQETSLNGSGFVTVASLPQGLYILRCGSNTARLVVIHP